MAGLNRCASMKMCTQCTKMCTTKIQECEANAQQCVPQKYAQPKCKNVCTMHENVCAMHENVCTMHENVRAMCEDVHYKDVRMCIIKLRKCAPNVRKCVPQKCDNMCPMNKNVEDLTLPHIFHMDSRSTPGVHVEFRHFFFGGSPANFLSRIYLESNRSPPGLQLLHLDNMESRSEHREYEITQQDST